jgi:hypothetical protein
MLSITHVPDLGTGHLLSNWLQLGGDSGTRCGWTLRWIRFLDGSALIAKGLRTVCKSKLGTETQPCQETLASLLRALTVISIRPVLAQEMLVA